MSAGVRAYRCLDAVISVETRSARLGAFVHELLGVMATVEQPRVRFAIAEHAGTYVVSVDDVGVVSTVSPSYAVAHLMWEINRYAITSVAGDLLLHAGAVTHQDAAIVVAGPSGAGKSTLVAALAGAGLGYLTDDSLAISAAGGARPHPKPIGLGAAAPELFPTLAALDPGYRRFMDEEWFVTPAMLGGSYGVAAPPDMVVFPIRTAGARTTVTPVTRAEGLVALAGNSFNFARLGTEAFRRLGQVLAGCSCHRIVYSEVDDAVDVVIEAMSPARGEAIA